MLFLNCIKIVTVTSKTLGLGASGWAKEVEANTLNQSLSLRDFEKKPQKNSSRKSDFLIIIICESGSKYIQNNWLRRNDKCKYFQIILLFFIFE